MVRVLPPGRPPVRACKCPSVHTLHIFQPLYIILVVHSSGQLQRFDLTAPELHLPSASVASRVLLGSKMSRNNGKGPKLDLRLGFSRSRGGSGGGGPSAAPPPGGSNSPRRMSSSSSSSASPPSSCVSSEGSPEPEAGAGGGGGGASMILAGCPRCMMYVMLSREDPKCPKCHSTVLLDFNDQRNAHAGFGGAGKVGKGKRG